MYTTVNSASTFVYRIYSTYFRRFGTQPYFLMSEGGGGGVGVISYPLQKLPILSAHLFIEYILRIWCRFIYTTVNSTSTKAPLFIFYFLFVDLERNPIS